MRRHLCERREKGMLGLAEFLEAKTIHIQTAEARAHWAP